MCCFCHLRLCIATAVTYSFICFLIQSIRHYSMSQCKTCFNGLLQDCFPVAACVCERLMSYPSYTKTNDPNPKLTHSMPTHAQDERRSHLKAKKRVHTQCHACAVCATLRARLLHLFRQLQAFFRQPKGRMVSGTRLVTGTVIQRVLVSPDRAQTAKGIKQRARIEPQWLHWARTCSR